MHKVHSPKEHIRELCVHFKALIIILSSFFSFHHQVFYIFLILLLSRHQAEGENQRVLRPVHGCDVHVGLLRLLHSPRRVPLHHRLRPLRRPVHHPLHRRQHRLHGLGPPRHGPFHGHHSSIWKLCKDLVSALVNLLMFQQVNFTRLHCRLN